jgi:tripartite ATP-independent transporter DctP family solute receptor
MRATAIIFVSLVTLGCGTAAPEAAWTVKFSHVYPTSSDYQAMAEFFRDRMAERTEGRFRVIIYPSGQLGGERVVFEQLQVGAQEMAISGTPVLSGWVPEGQIFDLPFLFTDRDQGLRVLNGPLGDWWQGLLLEKTGVRSLGFLDYGFRHVYNSKRPIRAPADLAGLKLRVLQSPTYLAAYEALGVQATPMNYGEVYSALQQGVIDGGEANLIGFATDRFYEVGRYFSTTTITYNPITLLINDGFFQSLPETVQAVVIRSAEEALRFQSRVARKLERDALEKMKDENVVITNPDLRLFIPLVRPKVWNEVVTRLPDGEQLLLRLQQALKDS